MTRFLLALCGLAVGAAVALPTPALASEGGGSSCPWAQDITLKLGRRTITVPQASFDPKSPTPMIDGYELRPDLDRLTLRIVGPRDEVWLAALTRVESGKRCVAFYASPPARVMDEETANAPAAYRPSGAPFRSEAGVPVNPPG